MKKVLLIAAIAVCSLKVSAQTEQGNIVVGGSVNFSSQKIEVEDDAATSFSIIPKAGYFIQENIALGTGIGFQSGKSFDGDKTNTFIIAPFGRYYKSISEQFKFFGELSVPMAFGRSENEDGDKGPKYSAIGVGLSPGFAFFPTKKFGIELSFSGISYRSETVKPEIGDDMTSNVFNIGADFFNPNIGLLFYF
ncbi:outer membrane beta-barrel protein [Desertivirga xinjiangensis]|uniref:outer membrane beta-barrel protein n=1 Tax=Desertivirga xinjiangensis TaxID=539206 RepID=UPI00210CDFE0|nr:outer membrane beta-barrel protein [Pedobacter xinjiangensis]